MKQRSDDDQEKELNSLRREIEMREVAIKLHDQKMRVFKDENTQIRMQLQQVNHSQGNGNDVSSIAAQS